MSKRTATADGTREPGFSLTGKFVASAALICVLAALGVAYTIGPLAAKGSKGASQPPAVAAGGQVSAATGSAPTAASDAASECGLKAVQSSGSLGAPPSGVVWSYVGPIAVPSIEGQGPGRIDNRDQFRSCYSRTPVGALLFAGNLVGLGSNPETQLRGLQQLILPGPGRDTAIKNHTPHERIAYRVQIAGFRILRYSADRADVDIAAMGSDGNLFSQVYNLVWYAGDWRYTVTDDAKMPTPLIQISSLAGYIPWSAA